MLAAGRALSLSVGMAWPRSAYNFTSLRSITLWEAGLPVSMVRMLGDCPLVEHVEFRDCRVRIAVDHAVATPPKRHSAFLEQFLEPLARYKIVTVEFPHVVLVDVWAPPADDAPPAWGTLHLDVDVDKGLGALLLWGRGETGIGEADAQGLVYIHTYNMDSERVPPSLKLVQDQNES